MSKYQVTLLVLSYNPDKKSLFNTLLSCVNQKDVKFEIVISDDGSKELFEDEIHSFFKERKFTDYKIIKQKTNKGTVKNYMNSIYSCEGEYIKCLAPGDLLYDDTCISDFIKYASSNNYDVVFGNSIYYYFDEKDTKVYPELHYPRDIKPYLTNDLEERRYRLLIMRDLVLALSYVLKTSLMRHYLEKIDNVAKFAEDTIYMLMVGDNVELHYYDRNIVWYEYGSGISTNSSNKWEEIIKEDIKNVCKILVKEHPEWQIVDDMNEKKLTPKVIINILKRRKYFKRKFEPYSNYDVSLLEKYR